MGLNQTLAAACIVLMGVEAVGAGTPGTSSSHRTIVTFSGPVALPGVSLYAGVYTFEIADPDSSGDAVVVMDRDRNQVLYMGLTTPVRRPKSLPSGTTVTFGTAFAGSPVPITAWYHSREAWGHQFVYGTR